MSSKNNTRNGDNEWADYVPLNNNHIIAQRAQNPLLKKYPSVAFQNVFVKEQEITLGNLQDTTIL